MPPDQAVESSALSVQTQFLDSLFMPLSKKSLDLLMAKSKTITWSTYSSYISNK